jgi:hypothetical protein
VVGSEDKAGLPLHLVDDQGAITRSFGAPPDGVFRFDLTYTWLRTIAPAAGHRIWAAPQNEYRIEQWDLTGRKVLEFARPGSWFEPWWAQQRATPEQAPQPRLFGLREDPEGRLWVLVHVADAVWSDGLASTRTTPEGGFWVVDSHDDVYDTILEVIDVDAATVVACQRLPMYLVRFVDDNDDLLAYGYSQDEDGIPTISIWQLGLQNTELEEATHD